MLAFIPPIVKMNRYGEMRGCDAVAIAANAVRSNLDILFLVTGSCSRLAIL
jgi:putative effector of murein hydrolase LrgA (UPF0299 family)